MPELVFNISEFPSSPSMEFAYAYGFGYLLNAVQSYLDAVTTLDTLKKQHDAVCRFITRALEDHIATSPAATPEEGAPAPE